MVSKLYNYLNRCHKGEILVPTGYPEFITATALGPTVLYISWEPPNVEHRNGVIWRYAINITEIQTMSFETFSTTKNNFTLINCHPFYQYHYTIAAETIGLGPFSSGNVIQMPEAGVDQPDFLCRVYGIFLSSIYSTICPSTWCLYSQCDLNLVPALVEWASSWHTQWHHKELWDIPHCPKHWNHVQHHYSDN